MDEHKTTETDKVVVKKEKLVFCGCGAEMGWLEEEWGVCQDCK